MRTIIRLQRIGNKNTQQYRIVVQPHKKPIKGRTIEHLGYWFPTKVNQHGRSIILNKNRARYWIATGAHYQKRIQQFFNYHDMAPAPWTSFGTKTVPVRKAENKKRFTKGINQFIRKAGMTDHPINKFKEEVRQRDEENLLVRKVKFQRALENYINEEEVVEDDNELSREEAEKLGEEDIKIRSLKFFKLKKLYEDIELNDPTLSPIRKEVLYKRMNELAEKGLLSEEEVVDELKEDKLTFDDAVINLYEQRQERAMETLKDAVKLLAPVSKNEFMITASRNTPLSKRDLIDDVNEIFDQAEEANRNVTKADLHIFMRLNDHKHTGENLTKQEIDDLIKDHIVPTNFPLTPVPDVEEYDPKDWFNTNDSQQFDFSQNYKGDNKWFRLPLTKAQNKQREENANKSFLEIIHPDNN